jgi:DNA-binding LacI/PurR family transcriptional regulator
MSQRQTHLDVVLHVSRLVPSSPFTAEHTMKSWIDKKKRVPLHRQCADAIRRAVETGKYPIDEYLPPERELSTALRVNRLTLRKGLAELIREGLLETVAGAGHRVVMTPGHAGKAGAIGCIMLRQEGSLAKSPFYAEIFESLESEISRAGYSLIFSSISAEELWPAPGTPRSNPKTLSAKLDGVALVGGVTDELALAYLATCRRVVLVDRTMAHPGMSSIVPDNYGGANAATRYLIDLGHRRFAFLGAAPDPTEDARFEGFRKALRESEIPFEQSDFITAGYTAEPARAAVSSYFSGRAADRRPTALVCINDEAAVGALRALREAGLQVPDDVSVVGFDDIALASQIDPPLTTLRINRREMGRLAARALLDQIESPAVPPTKLLLQTELIVRRSCTRPPERTA